MVSVNKFSWCCRVSSGHYKSQLLFYVHIESLMPILFKFLFLHQTGIQIHIQCCEQVWSSFLFWTICCATKWFSHETLLTYSPFNEHLYSGWPQQLVACGVLHNAQFMVFMTHPQQFIYGEQTIECTVLMLTKESGLHEAVKLSAKLC